MYGGAGFYKQISKGYRDYWLNCVLESRARSQGSRIVTRLREMRQALADTPPRRFGDGAHGRDDKRNLEAIFQIAEQAGTLEVDLPVRRTSLISELSLERQSQSNKRLVDSGILELVQQWKPGCFGNRFKLNIGNLVHILLCAKKNKICSGFPTLNHDIFTLRRLGGSAQSIYFVLKRTTESLSVPEIAEATGLSPDTVRKYLSTMAVFVHYESHRRFNLVESIGSKGRYVRWRIGSADLDEMSRVFDTVGRLERKLEDKKARYNIQREAFKALVADLRESMSRQPTAAEISSRQREVERERKHRIIRAVVAKRCKIQ
jgi:hypothetical protein